MIVRLVIDVMGGHVVRGVAGNRGAYQPVESVLTRSTAPGDVAAAFRDQLGIAAIYIADLDGLRNGRADLAGIARLVDGGFDVVADVGVRSVEDARAVAEIGVQGVVCALETTERPDDLAGYADAVDPTRLVFGLDLRDGRPVQPGLHWPTDPEQVGDLAVAWSFTRQLVLDVGAVGVGRGVPTLALCSRLRARHADLALITGGGVRDAADLDEMAAAGIDEALVASAVHDGTLAATDLRVR